MLSLEKANGFIILYIGNDLCISILPIRAQSGSDDVSDHCTPYQSGASSVIISPNTKLSGLVVTDPEVNISEVFELNLQVAVTVLFHPPKHPSHISTLVDVVTYPAINSAPTLCYITSFTSILSLVLATNEA